MSDASTELNANNSSPLNLHLQPPDKIVGDLSGMELESKIGAIMDLIKTADFSTLKAVFSQLPTFLHEVGFTEIWHFCNSRKRKIGAPMKSPLHVAASYREYEVVEYLVNSMGFAKALREDNFPWLQNGLVSDIIRDIHTIDDNRFEHKIKILQLIFSIRPDLIEARGKDGSNSLPDYTPLHIATKRVFTNGKQMEFIKHLLLFKADPNAKTNYNDRPPLYFLCQLYPSPSHADLREMAKLLVKNGADPRPAQNRFRSVGWFSDIID